MSGKLVAQVLAGLRSLQLPSSREVQWDGCSGGLQVESGCSSWHLRAGWTEVRKWSLVVAKDIEVRGRTGMYIGRTAGSCWVATMVVASTVVEGRVVRLSLCLVAKVGDSSGMVQGEFEG
jgi:hypothetical protein